MLDHGILNVPLAKRGNIDAQIDRYKADKAREEREARKAQVSQTKIDRAEAKALVSAMTTERLAELGKPHGLTAAAVRKSLMSDAHWKPGIVIRALKKEAV